MRPEPPHLHDLSNHALFFDIDGTLSDIAPRPEMAVIDEQTLRVLKSLRRKAGGALALISGRQIVEIDAMTGIPDLALAGIHGTQIRGVSGTITCSTISSENLNHAAHAALSRFTGMPGILIEIKPLSVALHFRERPHAAADVAAFTEEIVIAYPDLKRLSGKMIEEIVLSHVDKGGAILRFLAEPPFKGRIAFFAGDDVTDEDGFEAVNATGGISVKIGSGISKARYGFDDPASFRQWLAKLAQPELSSSGADA